MKIGLSRLLQLCVFFAPITQNFPGLEMLDVILLLRPKERERALCACGTHTHTRAHTHTHTQRRLRTSSTARSEDPEALETPTAFLYFVSWFFSTSVRVLMYLIAVC